MVDFGWSAETVVLILTAARKIYLAFKHGPREGKELLDDFGIFCDGLEKLDGLLKLYRCDVNVGCATWQRTISKCEDFQRKIERITNESKGIQQQFQKLWAATKHAFSKDVSILRQEINTSSQILAFQCHFVNLRISLEESEANRRSRAEAEESYRHHTRPLGRKYTTFELDSHQHNSSRPSTIPELGTVSVAEEPRTPIVHDYFPAMLPSVPEGARAELIGTPVDQARVLRNDLQRMRHELEAYDTILRLQKIELEGSIPQTAIFELSECNYDIETPVAQEDPIKNSDTLVQKHPGVTPEQIALTRSEIHDILERVSNIQKRSDSWADSGYGSMDSSSDYSLSTRSPFAHDARRRDTLVASSSLLLGSPLSTSPQLGPKERMDISDDSAFADLSACSPQLSHRTSVSVSPGSPSTSPASPSVTPMTDETMLSPLLSPKNAQNPTRSFSIRSNSDAASVTTTELCNGCVLQLTDANSTRSPSSTVTARRYPFEECTICKGDCETVLRYFRRPTSGGITLLISCKNSGKEIHHELSSKTWVVPHIRYHSPGSTYQVSFKEDRMTNGFRNVHADKQKFKPTYKFANEADYRSFQQLVFDKDLLGIFNLKSNGSSATGGSSSETLRIWRDRTSNELSILTHGALFENGKLQHYERSKSGFKPLLASNINNRKKSLRLYLSDTSRLTQVDRRSSFASDSSATSSRSSSGRSKTLSYIDLEFEDKNDQDDLHKFLKIWEPSILSSL